MACSEATPQPPPLGGCTGNNDAGCERFAGGGGGGGGGTTAGDSSTELDSGVQIVPDDGAVVTCGQTADLLLAPQWPQCAPCLAAGSDAGLPSCCTADSSCSQDMAGCYVILQCAIPCAVGAACSTQSCALASPASIVLFNTLVNCMASQCGALCPALSTVSADN